MVNLTNIENYWRFSFRIVGTVVRLQSITPYPRPANEFIYFMLKQNTTEIHLWWKVIRKLHLIWTQDLTSQTEGAENKLWAVEDCEAGIFIVFVLAIFKALKVFGVPAWTNLSDLKQVHWKTAHIFLVILFEGGDFLFPRDKQYDRCSMVHFQFHTFSALVLPLLQLTFFIFTQTVMLASQHIGTCTLNSI